MAVTISLYDHTARLFAQGENTEGDDYYVMLCTAATFDATNAILADITYTEVADGDGYTTEGALLSGVEVTTVDTNGAKFDADDATWTASGGPITASYAILYNATGIDSPPVAFIDFDGSESAADTTDFLIVWDSNGIFTWTVV